MLTLMHYLPYLLVAGLIALILAVFSGENRKTDYRRVPRERYYRWDEKSAHRD